ncbi:MAG: UDP-glucose 4-epimerase [Verrucomicrobiota bacterium]
MNIAVVTGGAGFIGSHVVDLLLAEGYRVHVVDNLVGGRLQNLDQHKDNSNLVVEVRDIREIEARDALFNDAQYVFHFAGIGDVVPSIERPVDYLSTNMMGTVRVLEAARFAGARKLVYAASSSCYGIADVPTREDAPIRPQYPYALSKYMGEEAVLHWGKVYKLPVNSIRIFNAYGTRSRTSGAYGAVFGVFLAQKLAGKPFTIVGDGTQRRDFLFVTDVAHAFYLAARTERTNEIYNLGAGDPQPVNSLVELLGGGETVHLPKRPGEPDCTWADITKIQRDLSWKPTVSLADGVARMVENIDYWRQAPVWDKQSISKATAQWFKYLRN